MGETLEMTLQERMTVLSLASKCVEMLEDEAALLHPVNRQQLAALAKQVRPILVRLDREWPAMLPLPHDGVCWSEREADDE